MAEHAKKEEEEKVLSPENLKRRLVYATTIIVITMFFITFFNMWYSDYIDRRSNKNFCELMEALDVPVGKDAPPRAVDINRRVHRLNIKLGCVNG